MYILYEMDIYSGHIIADMLQIRCSNTLCLSLRITSHYTIATHGVNDKLPIKRTIETFLRYKFSVESIVYQFKFHNFVLS